MLEHTVFCTIINLLYISLPESSSSSQGISLEGWAVSVKNDVASDSRYRTTCLFQASGLLLYFDKSIRSEVWHFQFPLTQIYCLIVALRTEFLLQWFSLFFLSFSLAIPQFGLLSHVSFVVHRAFRPCPCPEHATHASLFSSCSLLADRTSGLFLH